MSDTIYRAKRFTLRWKSATYADGRVDRREIIEHPGSVVILAVHEDERVVLIKNERVSVGKTLIELPAGTLEAGEEPLSCARRELVEEAGYEAEHFDALFAFYAAPGITDERMHGYVARGLRNVGQRLEANESITVLEAPLAEALRLCERGAIEDAKTLATLLYYRQFRGKPSGSTG